MHRDFLIYVADEGSVLLSPRDVQLLDWKSFELFRAAGWINTVGTFNGSRIVQITPAGLLAADVYRDEMNDELDHNDPEWRWNDGNL